MLTGHALAKRYAEIHPLSLENPGKVWSNYEGGGWIVLRGEGLKPHPDLAAQHPKGWNLFHRVRSSQARKDIANRENLIAAAPDLLAALQGLFGHCAMVHKHWGENANQKEADAAIQAARDALAKAVLP